jgi:hypothetical protein
MAQKKYFGGNNISIFLRSSIFIFLPIEVSHCVGYFPLRSVLGGKSNEHSSPAPAHVAFPCLVASFILMYPAHLV